MIDGRLHPMWTNEERAALDADKAQIDLDAAGILSDVPEVAAFRQHVANKTNTREMRREAVAAVQRARPSWSLSRASMIVFYATEVPYQG